MIENYFNDCYTKFILAYNISNNKNQRGAYIKIWKLLKESKLKELLKCNLEQCVITLNKNSYILTN